VHCSECLNPIKQPEGRGRERITCSAACRQRRRRRLIDAELKRLRATVAELRQVARSA
jgi:hypothetical protein